MNYKRKNSKGAVRRAYRYHKWGGKKSFKLDFQLKQSFNKEKKLSTGKPLTFIF